MPTNSVRRPFQVRIPFLEAVAVALTGDRGAEADDVDRRHAKLVQRLRGRGDRRDHWLRELRAALPADKHAALLELEAEWAEEAIAREEAAYRIGVAVERAHGCRKCEARRRRTARTYRAWLRIVKSGAWPSEIPAGRDHLRIAR